MKRSEAYQQLEAYGPQAEFEVNYTFRRNGKEFNCTACGQIEDLDERTLILVTNREEDRKDVINLERIVTIKPTRHATTNELAGHVT